MASKTIEAVELPMPLDTLIKVGMRADVDGHGDGLPIEGISVTLQPHRDPAAEGMGEQIDSIPGASAVQVLGVEAALLPYAVFDLGKAGWAYGRQVRRVHEDAQ